MDPGRIRSELARPEAFALLADRLPGEIAVDETHISVLLFTEDEVFKIKKPLNLGFLDFSTLEARRHFCEEEVRLNRPLAPGVYEGVVPVTETDDAKLRFGGEGPAIEWAVRMRRLPAERMMDRLLETGEADAVTPAMIQELAGIVASFHECAEAHPEAGAPDLVRQTVVGNLEECAEHIGRTLSRPLRAALLGWAERQADELAGAFADRAEAGCVLEGHGDLHSEHVCFVEPLVVYDRLEFSAELRRTDVAAEVGFLAMDLDHRDRRDLSRAWIDAYRARASWELPQEILDWYQAYRACVRGKVLSIKATEPMPRAERRAAVRSARAYFHLAAGYALRQGAPRLVLVGGPIATGKSRLAEYLESRLGACWIRSDAERKHLAGLSPTDRPDAAQIERLYSEEMTRATYERIVELARGRLRAGESVVLDATWRSAADREAARHAAAACGAGFHMLLLTAPEEVLRRRLRRREGRDGQVSDAREDLLEAHLAGWEWPAESAADVTRIDTSGPKSAKRDAAVAALLSL